MSSVTSAGLDVLRGAFLSAAHHAQYVIGGAAKNAQIASKKINGDGTLTVAFYIPMDTEGTVTACRVLAADNTILVEKAESTVISVSSSALYYSMSFSIYEPQPEVDDE